MTLAIRDLQFVINGTTILTGISAKARPGQVIGLLGPNGAGKTTLADLICGYKLPSAGKVFLDDQLLTGRSPEEIARLGVCRLFQQQRCAWNLSAVDIVLTSLDAEDWSWSKPIAEALSGANLEDQKLSQVRQILARVNLADVAHLPAHKLSFGQQRLLSFVQAITKPGKLVILDEPFTGVKSKALEAVLKLIVAERKKGRIIVVIDHMMAAVKEAVDSVWVLSEAHLLCYPSFSDFVRSSELYASYFGPEEGLPKLSKPVNSPKQVLVKVPNRQFEKAEAGKTPVLELSNVSGGYGKTLLLRNIQLKVESGDVLSIAGLNGSGKSTLLRMILGLADIFTGEVRLAGRSINGVSPGQRVRLGLRMLPQENRVFRTLSVADNLILSANLQPWKSRLVAVESALERLRSSLTMEDDFRKRLTESLSGGEQALLAMEHFEFGNFSVLLLDEPTSGVDGVGRAKLVERIHCWQGRGAAIIVVEHDLRFILNISSRLSLMQQGRLNLIPMAGMTADKLLDLLRTDEPTCTSDQKAGDA